MTVGQRLTCASTDVQAKSTKPPARFNEGSLLKSMETAGKMVDDEEAAEAMKDSGLGTPATRANIIESLIDREYVEREGKQLRATDKAIGLITMLGDHLLTSPELTGHWEQKLNQVQQGAESRQAFEREIEDFTRQVVAWFADKSRDDLRVERTVIAPCPINLPDGTEMVMPGDNTDMTVELGKPIAMDEGLRFAIREGGRTVGAGVVTKIVK